MFGLPDEWPLPDRPGPGTQLLSNSPLAGQGELGYGADVFGIGEYIRLHDPAYWNRVRSDWNTGAFPKLPVRMVVRVTISSVGEILCPLLGRC